MAQRGRAVEELADIPFQIAEVQAILSGKFDAKIEELKAVKAALEEKHATLGTLEEARALKERTEQDVAKVLANAGVAAVKAKADTEDATARQEKARLAEANLASREIALEEGLKAIAERERALKERTEELVRAAAKADQNQNIRAESIARGEADLARREAEFKRKTEQARALMAG